MGWRSRFRWLVDLVATGATVLAWSTTGRGESPLARSANGCESRSVAFLGVGGAFRATTTTSTSATATSAGGMFLASASEHGLNAGSCALPATYRIDLRLGAGAGSAQAELGATFDTGWGPRLILRSTRDSDHSLFLRGGARLHGDGNHSLSFGSVQVPQGELGYLGLAGPWLVEVAARASFVIDAGYGAGNVDGRSTGLVAALGGHMALGAPDLFLEASYQHIPPPRDTDVALQTLEGRLCSVARSLGICAFASHYWLPAGGGDVTPPGSWYRPAALTSTTIRGWWTGLMVGYGSRRARLD